MALAGRWTLTRYLIEERRRFPQARGDLNALILDISLACKAIARIVAQGTLGDALQEDSGPARPPAQAGSEIFIRMNERGGHLAGLASEAMAQPLQIPPAPDRGKYLLVFEPLAGAGNLDVNVPVGSLFSILRAPNDATGRGRSLVEGDFLQPGAAQVAAGYALYGPTTMLVLSVGNGVAGFTLDPTLGEFLLTHPGLQVPARTREFAINASNHRFWEPPVRRYVDECLAGRSGARGRDFSTRWIASTVAEVHRILLRGGVCLHPRDTREIDAPGRPHLLHEANPIGFLMEQAGGRASTGRQPLLGVRPTSLHQRVGVVFGSRDEVELIERYHHESLARETGNPLFGERSLFRD